MKNKIIILSLLLITSIINANEYQKICIKPNIPIALTSKAEADLLETLINTYSDCVKNYVQEKQRNLAKKEEEINKLTKEIEEENLILNETITDWNNFTEELKTSKK